jgi:hypothetical protein
VPEEIVQALSEELRDAGEGVRTIVDHGLSRFDRTQPVLASYVTACMEEITDSTALALGHFLCVATFLAFDRAFDARLGVVDDDALTAAREALVTESELQEKEPHLRLSAAASVATLQPHVASLIDRHMEAALDGQDETIPEEALGAVFGTVLVAVVALSNAVAPPEGTGAGRPS